MPKSVIADHIGQNKVTAEYDLEKVVAAAQKAFNNYKIKNKTIPQVSEERVASFATKFMEHKNDPEKQERVIFEFRCEIYDILYKLGRDFLGGRHGDENFFAGKKANLLVLTIDRAIEKELKSQFKQRC